MPVSAILSETEKLMKKTIDQLHSDLATIRTNRPSAAILEPVKVNYYGSVLPVNQVGQVAVVEGRTLEIRPFDAGVLPELEKGIIAANLGVHPNNDGKVIRINLPPLSEDRRKEMVRVVRKVAEDFRISLRNERRDALEKLKKEEKDNALPKDEKKKAEDKIQGLIRSFEKNIDEAIGAKEKEILEV